MRGRGGEGKAGVIVAASAERTPVTVHRGGKGGGLVKEVLAVGGMAVPGVSMFEDILAKIRSRLAGPGRSDGINCDVPCTIEPDESKR